MEKIFFTLLVIISIGMSISPDPTLDGSCFFLVNKGLSKSLRVDVTKPDNSLTTDNFTKEDNQVFCASLNKDNTVSLYSLRYPFKNLKFDDKNLLVQVDVTSEDTQSIPDNQKFTITSAGAGDYFISSIDNKNYFTADQNKNTITTSGLTSNCLQKWTLINVDNYSWDKVCIFAQSSLNSQFITIPSANITAVKLGAYDSSNSRFCLQKRFRNSYYITNKNGDSIIYLNVGNNQNDGAAILSWTPDSMRGQGFSIIPSNVTSTDNSFYIVTAYGKNIDQGDNSALVQKTAYSKSQIFALYSSN